jgi:hypothetical protein
MNKKIDPLKWFVLPVDLKQWIEQYASGSETSLVKQVPLTEYNKTMIDRLAGIFPIRRRYRGPRPKHTFMRDCRLADAKRVSVYAK